MLMVRELLGAMEYELPSTALIFPGNAFENR
jgi:hypothetical protein